MRTATLTPVFWNPSGLNLKYSPPEYEKEIEQFIADVAADSGKETNFYSLLPQYYEEASGSINNISYSVAAGAAIPDIKALPSESGDLCATPFKESSRPCVTDKGVRTELKSLIKAKNLPTGIGHEYIVFFPPGIDSCFGPGGSAGATECSGTGYCGYHGALSAGTSEEVEYANEPDNGDALYTGCTAVVGKSAAYQTINTTSHEVSESVTDPYVGEPSLSWYDQNEFETTIEGKPYKLEYAEIGDMCAWEFAQGDGALGIYSKEGFEGAQSDQIINGHAYLLQTEWDNAHSTCSISEETASTKSAFSDNATSPVQTGKSISFDGSASHAPVAIETYEWNWNDGSQPTVSTSATATHSYTNTGGLPTKSFAVTLTVTDKNGNTGTVTHTVEVKAAPPEEEPPSEGSKTAGNKEPSEGTKSNNSETTSNTTTHEETINATSSPTTTSNILLTSPPESSKSSAFTTLPSNALQITSKGNRRKGTLTLSIAVASPGVLSLSDHATHKPLLMSLTHSFTSAGQANLRIALTRAGRSLLQRKHHLTAHALIVFTPTGGAPRRTQETLHFQLLRSSKR